MAIIISEQGLDTPAFEDMMEQDYKVDMEHSLHKFSNDAQGR